MYRSQLPKMLEIIDFYEKSARLRKEFHTDINSVSFVCLMIYMKSQLDRENNFL